MSTNYLDLQKEGVDLDFMDNIWDPRYDFSTPVKKFIIAMATLVEYGIADLFIIPQNVWIETVKLVTGHDGDDLVIAKYLDDLEIDMDDIPF